MSLQKRRSCLISMINIACDVCSQPCAGTKALESTWALRKALGPEDRQSGGDKIGNCLRSTEDRASLSKAPVKPVDEKSRFTFHGEFFNHSLHRLPGECRPPLQFSCTLFGKGEHCIQRNQIPSVVTTDV